MEFGPRAKAAMAADRPVFRRHYVADRAASGAPGTGFPARFTEDVVQ